MCLKPQRPGHSCRINRKPPPPFGLVAATMSLAMVPSAQWDGKFIACFAPQSPALGKAQVVGVRGLPAADQAGPLSDRPDVLPVAHPAWLRPGQQALVDRPRPVADARTPGAPTGLTLRPFRSRLLALVRVRGVRCKGC
jgi:hypothetical protein